MIRISDTAKDGAVSPTSQARGPDCRARTPDRRRRPRRRHAVSPTGSGLPGQSGEQGLCGHHRHHPPHPTSDCNSNDSLLTQCRKISTTQRQIRRSAHGTTAQPPTPYQGHLYTDDLTPPTGASHGIDRRFPHLHPTARTTPAADTSAASSRSASLAALLASRVGVVMLLNQPHPDRPRDRGVHHLKEPLTAETPAAGCRTRYR